MKAPASLVNRSAKLGVDSSLANLVEKKEEVVQLSNRWKWTTTMTDKNSSEEDLLEGKEGLLAQEGMRELASLLQVNGEGAGKTRGMMKSRMVVSDLILDQLSKLLNLTLPR